MTNIVLLGYGYWGTNVARNIALSKMVNLKAICDMNPERLRNAERVFGDKVEYSTDYAKYLSDPGVDAFAVVIQTEPSFDVGLEVMDAGKHLFMEKPLATTAERALQLHNKAMEKNLTLHCDHLMIYHPIIRYIKKLYDSGEMGELMYVDVSRINLGPIRKDVNSMLDLAVHDIAVIDYLANGKEPHHVDVIGEKRYGGQESLTYLNLKYDGFIAHIKSSWLSPLKERRVMIGGTKKMLIFDDMKNTEKLTIYDHGIEALETGDEYGLYEFKTRTGDILIPHIPVEDALRNSIEHFASCIENKRQSISNGEQAHRVMKVLDTALHSLANQ